MERMDYFEFEKKVDDQLRASISLLGKIKAVNILSKYVDIELQPPKPERIKTETLTEVIGVKKIQKEKVTKDIEAKKTKKLKKFIKDVEKVVKEQDTLTYKTQDNEEPKRKRGRPRKPYTKSEKQKEKERTKFTRTPEQKLLRKMQDLENKKRKEALKKAKQKSQIEIDIEKDLDKANGLEPFGYQKDEQL